MLAEVRPPVRPVDHQAGISLTSLGFENRTR